MSCLSFLSGILTIMLPFVWLAEANAAPFAYITNYESKDVSVIDTLTNTVVKTIPIGGFPDAIAMSPAGDRIYVGRGYATADDIVVIENDSVVDTFETRAWNIAGMAITPDGRHLYIADFSTATVYVFDAIQGVEINSIPVGERPIGVAVHPAGTRVYVTNLWRVGGDSVSIIDTTTRAVIDTVDLGWRAGPRGIAVSPLGDRVYVVETGRGDVAVIDTVTHGVRILQDVGTGLNAIAIDPLGTRLYVTHAYDKTGNFGGHSVTVIDATTDTVIDRIRVGTSPYGIDVHPDGSLVYVANIDDDTVSVIDAVTNTVSATISVGERPVAWGAFIAPSLYGGLAQDSCVATVDSPAGTFEDLQEAIDAADNGATIKVEGVCTGAVEVYRRKNLTIEGVPPDPFGCPDGGLTPVSLISTVKGSDGAVIQVKKSKDITLRFLNIVEGEDSGIEFDRSEASVATCNSLVRNAGEGVRLERGKRNEVSQNLVMRNGDDGIKLYKSDENRVVGNSVFDNSDDGVEIQRSVENIVSHNDVRGNDEDGIDLDYADRSEVVGNVVVANGSRSKKDSGIELRKSDDNIVDANTINENADGLIDEIQCQKGSDNNTGSNVTPHCL